MKFKRVRPKNAVMFSQSEAAEPSQRFHSLHPSRVWWGHSLPQQDFNSSAPRET